MKRIRVLFSSFKVRVTLALIFSMLLVGVMSNFLIYKFALDSHFNQLREKLQIIAQTAALMIDAQALKEVPLNPQGINTPQFKIIQEKLKKIKEVNPPIRFIYTMAKTDKEGIWQFIVDADLPNEEQRKKGLTSYPGDKYNAARFLRYAAGF